MHFKIDENMPKFAFAVRIMSSNAGIIIISIIRDRALFVCVFVSSACLLTRRLIFCMPFSLTLSKDSYSSLDLKSEIQDLGRVTYLKS